MRATPYKTPMDTPQAVHLSAYQYIFVSSCQVTSRKELTPETNQTDNTQHQKAEYKLHYCDM